MSSQPSTAEQAADASTPATTGIIPSFWVESVELLRDFYIEKLGFGHMMGVVGKDGKLDFAIVTRDGLMVMMGRPETAMDGTAPEGGDRTVELYLYVLDVDACHDDVRRRGAEIIEPIKTEWWGDRLFGVRDPYGYTVRFCQTVAEVTPPPGVKMI